MVVNTHMEPFYARHVFPCFDEPSFKAVFKVSLTHQSKFDAIANMPLDTKQTLDSDWTRSEFQPTPKMSSYLLAFALFKMPKLESSFTSIDGRHIKVQFFYDPKYETYLLKVFNFTVRILELYEAWFQVPYPMPKLDLFTTKIPAFAMENWGLISVLGGVFTTAKADETHLILVLAHEIADQVLFTLSVVGL